MPTFSEGEFYECDADWYGFENSCYFFSRQKLKWKAAREICKQNGADLAVIQNQEENSFIFSELPSRRYS